MADIKTRDSASKAISRYLKLSQQESIPGGLATTPGYIQLLNEQWDRFQAAQDLVERSCGPENAAIEEEARVQAESWYVTALANFNKSIRLQGTKHNSGTPVGAVSTPVFSQVPKIALPIFSGDATEWVSFCDAFKALIDCNTNLAPSQKLQYLRSCLSGEALQLITNLNVSNAYYEAAWSLLEKRYKVLRLLVDKHLHALINMDCANSDTAPA